MRLLSMRGIRADSGRDYGVISGCGESGLRPGGLHGGMLTRMATHVNWSAAWTQLRVDNVPI